LPFFHNHSPSRGGDKAKVGWSWRDRSKTHAAVGFAGDFDEGECFWLIEGCIFARDRYHPGAIRLRASPPSFSEAETFIGRKDGPHMIGAFNGRRRRRWSISFILFACGAARAFAASSDAPAINAGDTAWMLVSTGLVLLMTPGLAFFYGGLVRGKNVLGTMMQSLAAMAAIGVLRWPSGPIITA
jgi:hypothetical protein